MNLTVLPYELLFGIYLEVPYHDVVDSLTVSKSPGHDPHYWVARANRELAVPRDRFFQRSIIEQAMVLPGIEGDAEWNRWRYVEIVSRRSVVTDSFQFVSRDEVFRRAAYQGDVALIQLLEGRHKTYTPRQIIAKEAAKQGNVALFKMYWRPEMTLNLAYDLGYGNNPDIDQLVDLKVLRKGHRFYEGRIAKTGIIPPDTNSESAIEGFISHGNIELLDRAFRNLKWEDQMNLLNDTKSLVLICQNVAIFNYFSAQSWQLQALPLLDDNKVRRVAEYLEDIDALFRLPPEALEPHLDQLTLDHLIKSRNILDLIDRIKNVYPGLIERIIQERHLNVMHHYSIVSLHFRAYLGIE